MSARSDELLHRLRVSPKRHGPKDALAVENRFPSDQAWHGGRLIHDGPRRHQEPRNQKVTAQLQPGDRYECVHTLETAIEPALTQFMRPPVPKRRGDEVEPGKEESHCCQHIA